MPNLSVVANNDSVTMLIWNILTSGKVNTFLGEVTILQSILLVSPFDQVVKVASSISCTARKTHVILPPINASDSSIVPFHLRDDQIPRIEVVHLYDVASANHGSGK